MGKKEKQEELPGLERRDIPEIEQAADRYRQIRDERSELSKREAEAKAALIQVMKNKGRQFYSYNGLNVQLSNQENVKVKAKDEDDEEPVGTFTQPKRKRDAEEIAEGWIEQAEELIEQQQAEAEQYELQADGTWAERERLHEEAVANWRRERPTFAEGRKCECGDYEEDHAESGGCMLAACDCTEFRLAKVEEEGEDYRVKWLAGLIAEERDKYFSAPCSCPHSRDWHGVDGEGKCDACECEKFHCRICDTKGGHQATCEHYVLGEGTPVQREGAADEEGWIIPATINQALHAALHHVEGAAERWRPLQEQGAADGELKAMIGREFGIGGGATQYGGYRFKGGKSPEFSWPGYADQSQARTLKGKRLLTKVRDVMEIGAPGQSSDPNADHSAAYPDDEIEAAPDPDGADDFTAPRCDECGRIDGGHAPTCSQSDTLTYDDYFRYSQAHGKGHHASHARKMDLKRDPKVDAKVREWKRQQASNSPGNEPEPKKRKSKKLSPVEAAIDR